MPLSIVPPKTVAQLTVTCDRCGKKVVTEIPVADYEESKGTIGLTSDLASRLPVGWKSIQHPEIGIDDRLFFDRRDCMGVWLSTYVRTTYGGPAELPKRRRRGGATDDLPVPTARPDHQGDSGAPPVEMSPKPGTGGPGAMAKPEEDAEKVPAIAKARS